MSKAEKEQVKQINMPFMPLSHSFIASTEVEEAKIPVFMKFANTIRAHWSGIIQLAK